MLTQKNILLAGLSFAVIGTILLVAVRAAQNGTQSVDLAQATVSDAACYRDDALYFEPCEVTTPTPVPTPTPEPQPEETINILAFSETEFYKTNGEPVPSARPPFIEAGIKAGQSFLKTELPKINATIETTDNSEGFFTDAKLATYDAVVFLSPMGDPLNNNEQAAFERYIQAGNGYVGIHYAGLTEGNVESTDTNSLPWPWYSRLVGRTFDGLVARERFDPNNIEVFNFQADFDVSGTAHPITASLPASFTHRDELYRFYTQKNSDGVVDLITLDTTSVPNANNSFPNKVADPHYYAWYQPNYDGGRSFYTAMGDNPEAYETPEFKTLFLNAVEWAAGRN